jgi:hypothetical protein
VEVNAEILLWDLTLTENDGFSNKCVKLFEEDLATAQAQIFRYDSNYLLFHLYPLRPQNKGLLTP